jgi:hypothetical protein
MLDLNIILKSCFYYSLVIVVLLFISCVDNDIKTLTFHVEIRYFVEYSVCFMQK